MALGLRQAGIDVRFAFDLDSAAIDTYRLNIGEHGHVLDARKVSGKQLLRSADVSPGELDILSGGPPCQGFSKQKRGAHLLDDERNSFVLDYARIVLETEPRSFIFENVEIFGQKRGVDLAEEVKQKLADYRISSFFICSSDFGLAQTRGRFVMIGIRRDQSSARPVLEMNTKRMTIKDVIGDLPPPPADCTEHPEIANHIKGRITKMNELRFSHVPPGGGWQDIPNHLRLPCHQNVDTTRGGWPDVYGRLAWEGQCPTITGGFDNFSRGRYGHPEQDRALTLREGARLQGFPDSFRFCGTRHDVRHQIGNAVPPPVAKAAGEAVVRVLCRLGQEPRYHLPPQEEAEQLALAV